MAIGMPRPSNRRGHKAMMQSDVCLSVCLTSDVCLSRTSGLSRVQRSIGRLKFAQR